MSSPHTAESICERLKHAQDETDRDMVFWETA